MSVILFSNSPFYNPPSVSRGSRKTSLYLQANSSLQPQTLIVMCMCIMVSTGQKGLVPAALPEEGTYTITTLAEEVLLVEVGTT